MGFTWASNSVIPGMIYSLFVLKMPLNLNQLTNQLSQSDATSAL